MMKVRLIFCTDGQRMERFGGKVLKSGDIFRAGHGISLVAEDGRGFMVWPRFLSPNTDRTVTVVTEDNTYIFA